MPPSTKATMGGDRFCSVCGEKIKKHQCIHFGALSCYSCRAFFRRLSQESQLKATNKLLCRRAGLASEPCDINSETRRFCQRCRYDKCLAVGMKPELVLTEEGKSRRFSKPTSQQSTNSSKHDQSSVTGEMSNESTPSTRDESALASALGQVNTVLSPWEAGFASSPQDIEVTATSSPAESSVTNHNVQTPPEPILQNTEDEHLKECNSSQMSFLRHAYNFSSNAVLGSHRGRCLVDQLIAQHGGTNCHPQSNVVAEITQLHLLIFESFASAVDGFAQLHPSDKVRLLERNAKLHLAYLLSRYILAKSGWEQLCWLVGESDVMAGMEEAERGSFNLVHPLRMLQGCMLQQRNMMRMLQHCTHIWEASTRLFPGLCLMTNKTLVALIMLFNASDINVMHPRKISEGFDCYARLIKSQYNIRIEEVPELIRVASSLADLIDVIFGPSHSEHISPSFLPMGFTVEEDGWLTRQLGVFDREFRSVPLGASFIGNWMTMVRGGKGRIECFAQGTAILAERGLRVLRSHSEFARVPSPLRAAICGRSALKMHVIVNLLFECADTTRQQARMLMGVQDEHVFEEHLKDDAVHLRKLNFELAKKSMQGFHPDIIAEYEGVQKQMRPLISSQESFQLLTLVSLFSPWTESESLPRFPPALLTVRNRYLVAMERRNAQHVLDIVRGMNVIERLADLIILFMS